MRFTTGLRVAIAAAVLAWPVVAFGGLATNTALVFEEPWTRATPAGAKDGAGYLLVINTGDTVDRLVAASSPNAERVEVYTTTMANGVVGMRRLDNGLVIGPRVVVELKPGGFHLLLVGLKKPIVEGDTVPISLTFEKAGKIDIGFAAAGVGAPGPSFGGPPAEALGSNSGAGTAAVGAEPGGSSAGGLPATAQGGVSQ